MIIISYLILFIIVLLYTKFKFFTIFRSNMLFTFIWSMSGLLSSTGAYGFYKPSLLIHIYIFLIILVYNTTYFYIATTRSKIKDKYNYQIRINFNLIYVLSIFSWIYMTRFLLKSIQILFMGGFNLLRLYAYDSSIGLASTADLSIAQIFIQPLYFAIIMITMYLVLKGIKCKLLFFVAIINVLVYTLSFAGRGMFVYIIYSSFFSYILLKKISFNYLIAKNLKKKIIYISLFSLIVLVYISIKRDWYRFDFFRTLYSYNVTSLSYLDILLEKYPVNSSSYLYGKAMFGFLLNPIHSFLTFVFKIPYNGSDFLITSVTKERLYVSQVLTSNALTSMIYPFLKDFGILGIICGTVFFSSLISFIENIYHKSRSSVFVFLLYVFILIHMTESIKNYYLYQSYNMFQVIYLYVFTYKNKNR